MDFGCVAIELYGATWQSDNRRYLYDAHGPAEDRSCRKKILFTIFFRSDPVRGRFLTAATIVHHERSLLLIAALTGNPDGSFKYSKLSGLALT